MSKNIWHSFFLQKKNILWQKFLTDKSLQEQLSFEQNVQPLVLTNHVYFVIKWVTGWEGLWEVTPAYFVTKFSLMLCLFWKTNEFWDHLLLSLQLGAGIIGRLEFINFQEQYFAPQKITIIWEKMGWLGFGVYIGLLKLPNFSQTGSTNHRLNWHTEIEIWRGQMQFKKSFFFIFKI